MRLRALAQALPALAAKPTEAQASQALDPVLKRIGQTTDPDARRALAAKLTEAQASQALDFLLKRIGQATDPAARQGGNDLCNDPRA